MPTTQKDLLEYIEKVFMPDEDFMKLYHRLEHGSDTPLDILACVGPAIYPMANSSVNFTLEYALAYVKYRMFILVCAQMVIDKLAGTHNIAALNDVVVKDVDSNLWSTLDKDYCKAHYNDTYFGFRNYKGKVTTVTLALNPLEPADESFLYKLPLTEHSVNLVRIDIRGNRKDLGLIKIKDINKSNLIKWARG